MAKNTFKYKCADCSKETFFHRREETHRNRMRCPSCGSLWLDRVTNEAKRRNIDGADAKRGQDERNDQ